MKNYFLLFFIMLALGGSTASFGQSDPSTGLPPSNDIADLSIFPNPVSSGKIYITTRANASKNVEIFDVLGKKIISTSLFGRELNITNLNPGIYILKIREGKQSVTRKLVVR